MLMQLRDSHYEKSTIFDEYKQNQNTDENHQMG